MKQWVNRISRYLRLYYYLVKFSVVDILVFRVNALVMSLTSIIWMALTLVFIVTIFSKVRQLGGWTFWEMVFLTGVHEIIFLLAYATFVTNLRRFVDDVRTGRFDQILLKPTSARFLVSFRSLDFSIIGSFLNSLFIFFFSLNKIISEVHLLRLIGFSLLLIFAYWICYLVYFIFASLALFFIGSEAFLDWIFETTDFDRYPAEIYPVILRIFLTFFLPILFFAYVPTAFLLGKIGGEYLVYGLMLITLLYFISKIVWNFGLKRYSSASS